MAVFWALLIQRHQTLFVPHDTSAFSQKRPRSIFPDLRPSPTSHWASSGKQMRPTRCTSRARQLQKIPNRSVLMPCTSARSLFSHTHGLRYNECGSSNALQQDNAILSQIFASLGISTNLSKASKECKSLDTKLRTAVLGDLVAFENDQVETMQSMAGYWHCADGLSS